LLTLFALVFRDCSCSGPHRACGAETSGNLTSCRRAAATICPPSPPRGRRSGSRGPTDGNLAAVSHGQHVPTPTAVTCRSEASITQLQNSGKIADGLTIVPWTRGRCLEWDFTRSDTLATSHLSTAVVGPGTANSDVHDSKKSKHSMQLIYTLRLHADCSGDWSRISESTLTSPGGTMNSHVHC